jgi:hypothetical protein
MAEKKGFEFSNFVTDKEKENEGVVVNYTSAFWLKIARIGCPAYKEYILKNGDIAQLGMGEIDPKVADNLVKEAVAYTIVKDWGGLIDEDGNEIEFTPEKCLEMFNESEDFFQEVFRLANSRNNFKGDKIAKK